MNKKLEELRDEYLRSSMLTMEALERAFALGVESTKKRYTYERAPSSASFYFFL